MNRSSVPLVGSLIEEVGGLASRIGRRDDSVVIDVGRERKRPSDVDPGDRARIAFHRAVELIRLRRRSEPASPTDERAFDEILDTYSTDTIYVHVGLRDVRRAFGRNPYEFVLGRLTERFENVLVPGFTPSFRTPGSVYDRSNSEPRFGAFARSFLDDADYRTEDATNSVLVKGEYRFEECDHQRSFAEEGCFGKLDADDVLYANIGTNRLVCSQLHYIEHVLDVPYLRTDAYEGTIRENGEYRPITQYADRHDPPAVWNREKIEADLIDAGILDRYDLNGLCLRFFRARELREFIASKIEADPYYLVTL